MVEVFKTNISTMGEAELLLKVLQAIIPSTQINFDLEDCDRILRIEGQNLQPEKILSIVKDNNYECEILF